MLTVRINGVEAYAATADLSQAGLQRALEQAEALARQIARHSLLDLRGQAVTSAHHDHVSPNFDQPVPSLADCLGLLAAESASVPKDSRLVDWQASLGMSLVEQTYLNSAGAQLRHAQRFLFPGVGVTASDGQDSQSRSLGRDNFGQQGGFEVIERRGLVGAARRVADEALQLLLAPNTPAARATCC